MESPSTTARASSTILAIRPRIWVPLVAAVDSAMIATFSLAGPVTGSLAIVGAAALLALPFMANGLVMGLSLISHVTELGSLSFSEVRLLKYLVIVGLLWCTVLRYLSEKRLPSIKFGGIEKSFIIFIVWALVCTAFSLRPIENVMTLVRFGTLLIVYLAAKETISKPEHVKMLLFAYTIAILSSSIHSFTGLAGGHYTRFRGFFSSANAMGIFLNATLPLILVGLYNYRRLAARLILGATALIGTGALLLTWSRASWVALFSFVVVFLFLENKKKLLFLLTILMIVTAVGLLAFSDVYSTIHDLARLDTSSNRRLVLWQHGLDAAMESPLVGITFRPTKADVKGTNTPEGISEIISFQNIQAEYNPHNFYIAMLLGGGIPGLILALLIYFNLFRYHAEARNAATSRGHHLMHSAILAMLAGALLNSFFEMGPTFGSGSYVNYTWLTLGVAAAIAEKKLSF